jgi:transcriptional regulator with XRE-family HTH domain
MELGQKIRQARQEAGLSQRQLCGEDITRNMLSLIENGAAAPSMKTLTILAERLGKPVSYFLDKNARDPSDLAESAEALRQAEEALAAGKDLYAAQLLQSVTAPLLLREKLLLSARIPGSDLEAICRSLPSLDPELLLRADAALEAGQLDRCGHLLAAAEDRKHPRWNLLMGKLSIARGQWSEAAEYLEKAEESQAVPLLETCFRELGDFKRAYEYACKQRR